MFSNNIVTQQTLAGELKKKEKAEMLSLFWKAYLNSVVFVAIPEPISPDWLVSCNIFHLVLLSAVSRLFEYRAFSIS